MNQNVSDVVREIMTEFAELTGFSGQPSPQRYLWTDAFAVCNFLELYRQTGTDSYRELAVRLVDQVHQVLGRHRADDPRSGWLSGLDEGAGRQHPTRGGLRIGKKLRERKPTEPYDERLEWDRDGQYYHYLTKCMHALNRVSRVTGDLTYNRWAMELAKTSHASFTYRPPSGDPKRMYWKMSIDLSYPLVSAMGQHDPLDGLITYQELQAMAPPGSEASSWPDLGPELADMATLCAGRNWGTDDPLGLGSLLADAYRVAQLAIIGSFEPTDLLEVLLAAAGSGLESYVRQAPLQLPVDYRLAFRELGLSIGLHALERLQGLIEENLDQFDRRSSISAIIETLRRYGPLAEEIVLFWLANQDTQSWAAHREINLVMLATSLAPEGYLSL
jgi:hypothetical protein